MRGAVVLGLFAHGWKEQDDKLETSCTRRHERCARLVARRARAIHRDRHIGRRGFDHLMIGDKAFRQHRLEARPDPSDDGDAGRT
jgi:hypothetical protein